MRTFTIENFKSILEEIDVEIPESFSQNSIIDDDLSIDSQEIVELVCEIEDEYNVSIEPRTVRRTDDVKTVVAKINNILKEDNNE
ncbi:hypothetical protein BUZ62_06675 [Staphylococcus pasteuri]|uniref:hypothetical protein n=1 Tax=Staphylococcus pasteuri TaxID=45972 RepID=UPI000D3BD46D|nr:hypothetical protein [Staphylococcus pasteuri]PTU86834.1 hypothetical protein BUZ62_06675 [Staphylococcus pasteuri]